MQPCFTAFELQGACWKSRETFKCPRRCKLNNKVTEFCKTLNMVQRSNWQIWQIVLSFYRWPCHFRLFETCQFVSKLDSVDSRKKRCWTRASWKRHPVDLDIQRWMRMWQSLDLPGVKPLYDVNAKKARPAKCTRHHWHQDTVHVFLVLWSLSKYSKWKTSLKWSACMLMMLHVSGTHAFHQQFPRLLRMGKAACLLF